MYAVRLHGRGGQGVVTTAELLAVAAFEEGRYAQAFPTFGSERTGAPVAAFCRMDDHPIRTHEPIAAPDCLIVADPSLFGPVDVLAGMAPGGLVLVNSADAIALPGHRVTVVPADDLALAHVGRTVPGTALLGAFAALTGQVSLAALERAIEQRFPAAIAAGNAAAARAAYECVRETADA
jgi:pyruvate ferredoxin oxidoreductase gamma subunit